VYTVSFVNDPTSGALLVEDDRVTFNLIGHVYNLNFFSAIDVGTSFSAFGRLAITNGTVAVPNASRVRLGYQATGFLIVGAGGLLAGSLTEIKVGNSAFGSLTLENNGDVIVDEVNIGFSNAPGEVTVTGTGSTLLANSIEVGSFGVGTLDIVAQGRVETLSSTIGFGNSLTGRGTVTVQGAGSRWKAGDLTVGRLDDGELIIIDGGLVTCTEALLSSSQDFSALPGTVTVAGAGSTFEVDGRLEVAIGTGQGTLRIQPGGTVRVTQDAQIGSRGRIQLEGGTFHTPAIDFEGVATGPTHFQWTSGTLHVGTFLGDLVNGGGVLAPGASAGSTTINGDYQHLAAATLQIEVGGTVPGTQYDLVNVTGDVLLEGNLQLVLLNGFTPAASHVFTILGTVGGFTGSFANVANGQRLATTDGLGSFVVNYGAGSALDPLKVMLTGFRIGIPGDYNGDGAVNAADYVLWRDHLGQSFSLTNENPAAATPGLVDAEDYAFWKSRFGQTAGSGAAANANAAVPEPTSLVMLLVGVLGVCARHRDRVLQTQSSTIRADNLRP
jgi:T5SS/PEP-CTERM-associated repeat protein